MLIVIINCDEKISSEVLNADNEWKYTFTDLPKYDQKTGEEIKYTIKEEAIEGYSSEITGDETSGFTITNTKILTEIQTPKYNKISKDGNLEETFGKENPDGEAKYKKSNIILPQTGEVYKNTTLLGIFILGLVFLIFLKIKNTKNE
ncbi:TPA: Cna B-type domain-containing protein [Clostridium perfringens]|nr:Cna B-type domain-containing protein [Clostridium perfringens]HAT4368444.1 Cna B-type domain-containing protein [Clostridium perfringens]